MTFEEFEEEIFKLTCIDLTLYKRNQMQRRLDKHIERLKLGDYSSYLNLLKSDAKCLQKFIDYITINVTDFFRTKEHWDIMAEKVLADLPDDATIWSTACSSGEEPYSLAISIAERRPLANISIIATDIDENILEKARRGEFKLCSMSNVAPEIRKKYFTEKDNVFRIKDEIRSHVVFRRLDLLSEKYPENCDLIACRNILIYFTEKAQNTLYHHFSDSLKPGGFLFTGNAEQIINYTQFDFEKVSRFLYMKNTKE